MCGPGALCPAAVTPEKSITPIAKNFATPVQFVIISAHLGALRISSEALYTTPGTTSPRHNHVPRRPRGRAIFVCLHPLRSWPVFIGVAVAVHGRIPVKA